MYSGTTTVNDSYWMDPNITGQTKEGINYKILVAPFILDLDGRVNLATAGTLAGAQPAPVASSRGGQGPWEINPLPIAAADTTAPLSGFLNLLTNNQASRTRFHDGSASPNTPLPAQAMPATWFDSDGTAGPSYARYAVTGNVEANYSVTGAPLSLFPSFPATWINPVAGQHPAMFDFHNSARLSNVPPAAAADRRLAVSNNEALLRCGELGTPAVTADFFRNMPTFDMSKPTHRNVLNSITTFNMSVDVPHLPWFVPGAGTYSLTQNNAAVAQAALTAPQSSTFSTTNADQMLPGAMLALNGAFRFNLNQPIPSSNQPILSPNVTTPIGKIFAVLRNITGLSTANPTTWQFTGSGYNDASGNAIDLQTYRYLAQLAVNLVDYTDSDNLSTMFNWTGQQNDKDIDFVFGVEQPRLVLNEAYATWDNDGQDTGLFPAAGAQKQAKWYRLNIFFELLNPTASTTVALTANGQPNGQPIYRVIVAKDTTGIDTPDSNGKLSSAGQPTNIVADADNGQVIISNWNPAGTIGPNNSNFSGNSATGFLMVGPPVVYDKTQPPDTFFPPLSNAMAGSLPNRRPGTAGQPSMVADYAEPGLSIKVLPPGGDLTKGPTMYNPTLVLQRLADPTSCSQPTQQSRGRPEQPGLQEPRLLQPVGHRRLFREHPIQSAGANGTEQHRHPRPERREPVARQPQQIRVGRPHAAVQGVGVSAVRRQRPRVVAQNPLPAPTDARDALEHLPPPQRRGLERPIADHHAAVRLVRAPRSAARQSRRARQRQHHQPGLAHAQERRRRLDAGRGDDQSEHAPGPHHGEHVRPELHVQRGAQRRQCASRQRQREAARADPGQDQHQHRVRQANLRRSLRSAARFELHDRRRRAVLHAVRPVSQRDLSRQHRRRADQPRRTRLARDRSPASAIFLTPAERSRRASASWAS